jgi:ornithine cyclodeaminase
MQFIDAEGVRAATPYSALVDAIADGLRGEVQSPSRSVHVYDDKGGTLMAMPAWRSGGDTVGIKILTVCPGNVALGLPAIDGIYVGFDLRTGTLRGLVEGTVLTARRTAAVSALGARYLARPDARRLLVIGTGAVSSELPEAHTCVHDLETIMIWGRSPQKAALLASECRAKGLPARQVDDLAGAAGEADIIAAATTVAQPIIFSDWVQPGTHLSLLGAYNPGMAEAAPELVARSRIFADSRAAVLEKGGEIHRAIAAGLIRPETIEADLASLASGYPVARGAEDITLLKSVGFAALDLIAADLVLTRGADVQKSGRS